MVSHNTTLVPSLGLRIGPACEAGLSAGIRRERVSPQIERKKEEDRMFIRYGRMYERDRHTDRHRMTCIASRSKNDNKTEEKNNAKNLNGSLTAVVRAQNDTSKTANITTFFHRTYWYSLGYKRRRFENR